MNFIRFQNEFKSSSKAGLQEKLFCGTYGRTLDVEGGHEYPKHHTVWIPDGVVITDSISIKSVNGQLVATTQEDDFVYFWVSGARGCGHNNHKRLLIPSGVELLAAGGKEAHKPGCCNKITSVIFRVPKGAKRVIVGDLYYGEYSHAIIFTCANGEWTVAVEPLDRFCALNPDWTGPWTTAKGGEPRLPLPALVE